MQREKKGYTCSLQSAHIIKHLAALLHFLNSTWYACICIIVCIFPVPFFWVGDGEEGRVEVARALSALRWLYYAHALTKVLSTDIIRMTKNKKDKNKVKSYVLV